jgi:hypothetical protein
MPTTIDREQSELRRALDKIEGYILAGLAHGFFAIQIECEIVRGGKRQLTVKCGKSHRFVIDTNDHSCE